MILECRLFQLMFNNHSSFFPFILLQLQLLEAREVLEEKDSTLEDKEHMIRLVMREKDELSRENEVNLHGRVWIHRVVLRFVYQLRFPLSESQK